MRLREKRHARSVGHTLSMDIAHEFRRRWEGGIAGYQIHDAMDGSEAEQNALQWRIMAARQLLGMQEALDKCGCNPGLWEESLRDAYRKVDSAKEFLREQGWEV